MVSSAGKLIELLNGWEGVSRSKFEFLDLTLSCDHRERFCIIFECEDSIELDGFMLRFVNYLISACPQIEAGIVSDHIQDMIRLVLADSPAVVYFVPLRGDFALKDSDGRSLLSGESVFKFPRDSKTMRALLRPRFFNWMHGFFNSIEGEAAVLSESVKVLIEWARSRRVFASSSDCGFLSVETLYMMLVVCVSKKQPPRECVWSVYEVLKGFFGMYSVWNYSEGSVGSDCCRAAGQQGSFIDETDGLDSDVDGSSAQKDKSTISKDIIHQTPPNSGAASLTDENEEIHPHKRLRYELGQMRDIRRYYEVENSKVKKISMKSADEFAALDWLDVMSVMHPTEDVNLAVRTLESHRKLIAQEMVRAHHILTDDSGTIDPRLLTPLPFRRASAYIVFRVTAESRNIRSSVAWVVEDQNWFLIQEIQAFVGVLVTPSERYYELQDGSVVILTGLTFVQNEPYSAIPGLQVDVSGPMSRVLVRSRKILRDRTDFADIEKKFAVTCSLVQSLPQEWIGSIDSQF